MKQILPSASLPRSGPPARRKLILFKIVAMLLGLSVAVLLAEVVLRVAFPRRLASASNERDLFCVFDPELGRVPKPDFSAVHQSYGFSVIVRQTGFGLRGPEDLRVEKQPGRRRVLVLGDSYVWGFGVNQSELFSEPEVHQSADELLNFGVSGYGTDQELLYYLRRGTNFGVDEVVLAFTPYNDIENNLAAEQYGYAKPYFTLADRLTLHRDHVRPRPLQGRLNQFRLRSRVWNLIDEGVRSMENSVARSRGVGGVAAARAVILRPEDVTARDRAGVELTLAILLRLRDEVKARGAEFSVIFIPYKPHVRSGAESNHPLVPLIAAGLARAGVNYREPYPEFVKAEQGGVPMYNSLDNHFSPAGHALFAQFLTRTGRAAAALNTYGAPAR